MGIMEVLVKDSNGAQSKKTKEVPVTASSVDELKSVISDILGFERTLQE